jgi:hypothetical protein
MPTIDTTPTTGDQGAQDAAHATCSVCPHAAKAHDRIGTRYCAATVAGGLRRGCVCVGGTGSTAAG